MNNDSTSDHVTRLPPPVASGDMDVERAIEHRRSIRSFKAGTLTWRQVSQLCWAGQGITEPSEALRAAPSAGALYPIELYVVMASGVYHYRPESHSLISHSTHDVRAALREASMDQAMISAASACFVMSAVVDRVANKYGEWAERYTLIEVGHAAQNIMLQAVAMGLGSVAVGAFDDQRVASVLELPADRQVYYLLPVGHPG